MTKIISFLNQKGGVGKTTISTNIAISLQMDNQKVLLGAIPNMSYTPVTKIFSSTMIQKYTQNL